MTAQTTPRLGLPVLVAGQAQKEVTHNEALALLDAGVAANAEGAGLNAPPTGPTLGQCWIAGPAPTGAWAGQAHALAIWTGGGWRFLAAPEGMRVWLKDRQVCAVRRVSGWSTGAAIAVPVGGATADVEARAAITAVLARLAQHGLIEA